MNLDDLTEVIKSTPPQDQIYSVNVKLAEKPTTYITRSSTEYQSSSPVFPKLCKAMLEEYPQMVLEYATVHGMQSIE